MPNSAMIVLDQKIVLTFQLFYSLPFRLLHPIHTEIAWCDDCIECPEKSFQYPTRNCLLPKGIG